MNTFFMHFFAIVLSMFAIKPEVKSTQNIQLSLTNTSLNTKAFSFGKSYKKIINNSEIKFLNKGKLSVRNINGNITVKTHDKNTAIIKITKFYKYKKDLENLIIEKNISEKELIFNTKFKTNNNGNIKVNFEIILPKESNLQSINTINGDIYSQGIKGKINTSTKNGKTVLNGTHSSINSSTVNGTICIEMNEIPTNSKSQIHTVNGNISLKLSNKVSLKLKAKTINGEISSEFPGITAKNGFVGNKIEATIGKQNLKKALVNIKAINGKVLIQKG